MKVKTNLFSKIFLFSISLVIVTIGLSYMFSMFVSDSFYIYRKEAEIKRIIPVVKRLMFDENIFKDYTEEIKDTQGIDIYVLESSYYDYLDGIEYKNEYAKIEDGFHINKVQQGQIVILLYKEKLASEKILLITTSLSVMSSHRHEVYLLNLITMVIALCFSIVVSRFFAKKITNNITELNRATRKIAELDFSEKSYVDTNDELLELSNNINIMSNSLAFSIENLKSFVSNASHELKTPITVINSYAQILLKEKLISEDEKRKYYRGILKESNNMNILVQDLLLLSKLSALDLKLDIEKISLNSMVKESLGKYELLELEKDIEWDISIKGVEVLVDRKFFQIAINNIIQNALKYSPNDSIIKIYEKNDDIIVENSMPISEDINSDSLIQPFTRGKNANELNIEGHGLGLAIIKKILDLHNTKFNIEIKDNKFLFSLTHLGHKS